jgi:ELWxxDGT repeat protein
MKKQLPVIPLLHGLISRGLYKVVYIFLLMICGAAYSQPTILGPVANDAEGFVYVNGALYFSSYVNLYKATPGSAPTLVKATGDYIDRIYDISLGNNFFFVTGFSSSGQTLWRSDGTAANTVEVASAKQIVPLLVYNSELYLLINSAVTGVELFKMDASFNITLLKDINPGSSWAFSSVFENSFTVHNGLLYFFASAGSGQDLWKTNGTSAGTVLSVDMENPEGVSHRLDELTSVNGTMFFSREYEQDEWIDRVAELWKTDGTSAGTSLITHYNGSYYTDLSHFTAFHNKLYFFHVDNDPAYVYFSVSDGTAAGTQHLHLVTIDGYARVMLDAESFLLFYGDSQSFTSDIEKFDGTTVSVLHSFSDYHSAPDEVINLTYTEGRAFFTDDTGDTYGDEPHLWQSDLASGISRPVDEIYNMTFDGIKEIVAADGSIYFVNENSGQLNLWYYDPSASPATCEGTGNILREIWTNVPGSDVRAFDFSTPPTGGTKSFTSFETSQYYANNYASRMRGLICVPQTGYYTFWISSDDQSELYLSEDASEVRPRLIAWVYGYTPFRNYDKYPTQKSSRIYLEANRKYYIEARHKEANGNDFISVGWQLPDGTMQRPIPGNRLTPVTTPPNQPPVITITSPQPDQSFPSRGPVTIAANVTDPQGIDYVTFYTVTNGERTYLMRFQQAPYEFKWSNVPSGRHEIIVAATDETGLQSTASVTITVEDQACTGTGTIVREIWRNITGTSISSIPVNSPPSNTVTLTSLSTPNYYANDYGSRIRGYFCPPATGTYVFYISADDTGELWISSNDSPENKSRVASVPAATRVNQYNKYMSQFGDTYFVQGQRYYFEILHKEANGADHVEVGWELPDGTSEFPVPGNRLIPFEDPSTSATSFAADIFTIDEETTFTIFPNPAVSGRQVSLRLPVATEGDVAVDIRSITGVSVQRETLSPSDNELLFDLVPSISTGMYLITVSNGNRRWATKLQVK